jgi:osmotically-inducible protein OsmY
LYRAIYRYPALQRYAIDPAKPIRIVVDNGHVTLYGVVDTPLDRQVAGNQANSVPGIFSVDNQLIVSSQQPK